LASLTDSIDVIPRDSNDASSEQVRWLIEKILTLLARMAAAGNSDKAAEFRNELEKCRKAICSPAPGESIDLAARKCLAICQDYFQSSESYRLNTEQTYNEIVDLLRHALRALAAGSEVDDMVITSSTRFRTLLESKDLPELKRQILAEVSHLEHSVHAHRANRQKTISELNARSQTLEQRLMSTRARLTQTLAENATDSLTRVANRRHFDEKLPVWLAPGAAEQPFVLALVDIDNFKKVNDTYGHQVGDKVLAGVAQVMRNASRDYDLLARYGGEEFVVLFRNIKCDKAIERCKSILRSVAAKFFEWETAGRTTRIHVTVSCGLTEYVENDTGAEIIRRADTALYQAKRLGKNRVEVQQKQTPRSAA
jgi:diguanylate cyclase (GGDEF)-like protein